MASILGEQEAIQFSVPEASGTQAPLSAATSGTAQLINLSPLVVATGIGSARYCYVTFVASEDCHVVFGDNTVVATSTSWPIFKGQEYNRIINIDKTGFCSVVQDITGGRFWIGRTNP